MGSRLEPATVCFDLGGVLVRIRTDWGHANPAPSGQTKGIEEPAVFGLFQAGEVSKEQYLSELADYLGVQASEALTAHRQILLEPYGETLEMVQELEGRGVKTGCLSNTNAIHWDTMMDASEFPAVARLQFKVASHLANASKPDAKIFRHFEKLSGSQPSEIVYFDDSHGHVQAANDLGWRAFRIDPEGDPVAQMRGILQTFGLL